jgi:hypothetical protein
MNEIGRNDYLSRFPEDKRCAALQEARENRKFEIEMYWKRATYFWAFIAAAFAGYFFIQDKSNSQTISFVTACLGFIFSLAWYFVNRGSKYWQQNWELHVDLLEDGISGPIYKTVVQPSMFSFCQPSGAYPFSVSKINQLLSMFVTAIWLVLMARTFAIAWSLPAYVPHPSIIAVTIITTLAAIFLFCKGRTRNRYGDAEFNNFYQRKRTYK